MSTHVRLPTILEEKAVRISEETSQGAEDIIISQSDREPEDADDEPFIGILSVWCSF